MRPSLVHSRWHSPRSSPCCSLSGRWLAGQIVFQRDSALWLFPARWFVRQSLLAGEFPGWNPYQGLGFPLLADPQYGVFYPPNWLFLLVPDGMVAHLMSWLSLAHLAWAAWA